MKPTLNSTKQLYTIAPRWLTLDQAATYCGIGSRTLQTYIQRGLLRSSNVVIPGATRGRRLIDRLDLDRVVEAGVDAPPTELVMNATRKSEVAR